LLNILDRTICKHGCDPNIYAEFTDVIPKKAWWWQGRGGNM